MKNRKIKCSISYKHTLSELSVNRKYPCEVIRELISNSYDAEASVIQIYPLLQYSGLIFFDNGTGLSDRHQINDVIPLDAFFSIGLSTKTPGESIGYKCQGSKLCFASNKFALITRCGQEDEKYWRSVVIDNPTDTLDQEQDNIEAAEDKTPWLTIKKLLTQPDSRTRPIIEKLNQDFFSNDFKTGTLIFVKGLKIEDFSEYYNTDVKHSYLNSYIKYFTRHGDIIILNPNKTGFTSREAKMFKESSPTSKKTCQLFIWNCSQTRGKLDEIPAGYPYIEKQSFDRESESHSPSSPAEIKKLSLGRFSSRKATTFNYEGNTYCVTLAIDGNRRALDSYEDLDRQGKKKSGIGFGSQRGTFICSEGIKICPYNDIFNHSLLSADYSVLSNPKAQSHYFFAINGSFRLVTNRNDLSEDSIKILKSKGFIEKIRDFLDILFAKDKIFEELVLRIAGEVSQMKIETQVKHFQKAKSTIEKRDYFYIKNIKVLKEKKLLIPKPGEEHGVGALYTLLSYFIPGDSEYLRLWLRPLNFSGQGLDSIAEDCNKVLKGLEYKYAFSTYEVFNHPFLITDQIICWNTDSVQEGDTVSDGEYQGLIKKTEELSDVGFLITEIVSHEGEYNGAIKLISLKKLIDKTFNARWVELESAKKNRRQRN